MPRTIAELDGARGIVEQLERRLLAAAEERRARPIAEPVRDDDADRRLAAAHLVARLVDRGVVSGRSSRRLGAGHDCLSKSRCRPRSTMATGSSSRLRRDSARPAEDRSEERRDRDRHDEADDHRAAVAEEQLQVLADHGERDESHQSRRLLPVSVRNTDSSEARCPATAGTRRCRPASVSSAITLPWSMTTMRSARRSTSSM